MTAAERERLAELAAKATPGPWEWVEFGALGRAARVRSGIQTVIADANNRNDAAFVAAARTAVPSLLSALSAAEAERDKAHERVRLAEEWREVPEEDRRGAVMLLTYERDRMTNPANAKRLAALDRAADLLRAAGGHRG